jgi:hypothetical protein
MGSTVESEPNAGGGTTVVGGVLATLPSRGTVTAGWTVVDPGTVVAVVGVTLVVVVVGETVVALVLVPVVVGTVVGGRVLGGTDVGGTVVGGTVVGGTVGSEDGGETVRPEASALGADVGGALTSGAVTAGTLMAVVVVVSAQTGRSPIPRTAAEPSTRARRPEVATADRGWRRWPPEDRVALGR